MEERMKNTIFLCSLLLILTPFLLAHEEVKDLTLDSAGINNIDINCGAGFCKVYGQKRLNKINVEAEIIIKGLNQEKAKEYIEDEVVLSLEKRGDTAYLVSNFRPRSSFFSYRGRVINITVHLPYEMNLDLVDGSGSLLIENIHGRLKLKDGSGEMQILDVQGNLDIEDGSGNIEVTGVNGDLMVKDGSGDFKAVGVEGVVDVDDGSGTIRIKDALGNVRVNDGSGSIIINGIEKDVIIQEEGSGNLDISNVRGEVRK
jgi:hypothetical protein